MQLCPDEDAYKLYYAQSLYKVCLGMLTVTCHAVQCSDSLTCKATLITAASLTCKATLIIAVSLQQPAGSLISVMQASTKRRCRMHAAYPVLQAGMYPEAARAAVRISNPDMASQVNTLLVVNAYEQDDLPGRLPPRGQAAFCDPASRQCMLPGT